MIKMCVGGFLGAMTTTLLALSIIGCQAEKKPCVCDKTCPCCKACDGK